MVEADAEKVNEELLFADGILLGTPTIVGVSAQADMGSYTCNVSGYSENGGKYAGAFGKATVGAEKECRILRSVCSNLKTKSIGGIPRSV